MFVKIAIEKVAVILFFALMLCVILLVESYSQPSRLKKEVAQGKLYSFSREREYWCELTDFCVKDQCLYVLFGNKGVLEIYDLGGNYIKSYAFYRTKGESQLYTDDQYVYLRDQQFKLYLFSAGDFIRFENIEYSTYLQELAAFYPKEEQRKTDGAEYYVKLASIYRMNANGSSDRIVHRPFFLAFFQGLTPFVIGWILLAGCWFFKTLANKR